MKKLLTILLIITTLVFGVLCVYSRVSGDRVKPEITVPSGDLTYTKGQNSSQLLVGATAYDNKDGDITANIRIYDIAVIEDKNSALITYAVYDKAFNLGKATKVVRYIAEESGNGVTPITDSAKDDASAEKTPESTEATTTETKAENVTTEKAEEKTTATEAEKTTVAEVEKTTAENEKPVLGSPVIKLSADSVTIKAGEGFSAMDYVEDVTDDKDTRTELFRNVRMTGDYSTKNKGTYELSFYCIDSDGNRSNTAVLTLKVD